MWSFKKTAFGMVFLALTACGFQPLYTGTAQPGALAGDELSADLASVFIDEIAGVDGQILRRQLMDSMTPEGNHPSPSFRLSVALPEPAEEQSGIRSDNIATRTTLTYTATYTLTTFPGGQKVLKDTATAMGSYNIVASPYATEMAIRSLKRRLSKMLGNDIALRVAVYLRNHPELANGSETDDLDGVQDTK